MNFISYYTLYGTDMKNRIIHFYSKYKKLIIFNRNLLIAAILSLIASTVVTHFYAQISHAGATSSIENSILSSITDVSVYFTTFGVLFYHDNRTKYIEPLTGKRDSKTLRQDITKLVTAFSISEIIYVLTKFSSLYLLLQGTSIIPYQAAIIASLVSWVVYFVSINVIIKLEKFFK